MQRPATRAPKRTAGRRGPGRPAGRSVHDGLLADREALLSAAERLIRAKGPMVTLDAIAAEAGVTKPILYRGVGDKDALVQALAERLVTRMTAEVSAMVAQADTPRARLARLVGGYLQSASLDRHIYLFVTAGGRSDDRVRQALLLADRTAHGFAEGIAASRTAQGADPGVAMAWAYGLIGALHFVTLWWLRDATTDTARVAEQITALLWSGLGGEGTTR
jgi:AcrR family transcriptional regulator